jgi:hypothetical protein
MSNDAFATLLLVAAIPAGVAGGILGVWVARNLIAVPLFVW